MTKPPPPRYKIFERDGRLVTIDTWAKDGAPPVSLPPVRNGNIVAKDRGVARALVAALLSERDDQGRIVLTTTPRWDRKAPRAIALSAKGEQRVGAILLLCIVAAVVAIIAALIDLDLLLPMMVVAAAVFGWGSSRAAGALTRVFDGLGEGLPR